MATTQVPERVARALAAGRARAAAGLAAFEAAAALASRAAAVAALEAADGGAEFRPYLMEIGHRDAPDGRREYLLLVRPPWPGWKEFLLVAAADPEPRFVGWEVPHRDPIAPADWGRLLVAVAPADPGF